MNHIRILLVDDHTLFRSGVKALLQRQEDFEVVGEASDGLEGVKLADTVEADVMLLDMDMPSMNGRDVLEQVHEAHPNLAILMLTVSEDTALLSECLAMGARGYLLKNIDQDFLLRAVRTAAQGESIMSPQMMTKFLERFKATFSHMPQQPNAVVQQAAPAAKPTVQTVRSPAPTAGRPSAPAPAQSRHPAVRDFTVNGRKVPARSDKKLRQLFDNFRRSLNEDLTRSRSPEDLYGEITERRKETRGGPNYILKMLAELLRDIVCTHPEYESADWMLSSANRALKRRYFSRFLSIMKGRMKSRQIGLPHGRYHDQAIRTKADGSPSGLPSEPELALQRSLEFLSNLNRIDSPLPGVKDITVLPEPVYNAESERDYAEVRDVKDDDRKDDELFDTKDQFCVDFSERFCPTPLAFPELNPKSLHRQLRDAVAMTVLPKMPLVYVRAYNLLLDYNMPVRKVRDQVERSYFLTHLLQANLRVVEAARTVGVERTHLYRKLKRHGIIPKELNQEANGRIRELREERAKAEKERREQERAAARNNKKSGGATRNARSRKTAGNKKS